MNHVTASCNMVLCPEKLFQDTNRTTKNRCNAKNFNSLYLSNKLLSLELLLMIIFKKEYILLRNVILHIVKVTRNISLLVEKKTQFIMLWSECKSSNYLCQVYISVQHHKMFLVTYKVDYELYILLMKENINRNKCEMS